MWMNGSEVEDAADRLDPEGPYYVPEQMRGAVLFLAAFMRLIDSISDGWAYWSYGTKCSDDLQAIVALTGRPISRTGPGAVTTVSIHQACQKVRIFLRRCKQTKCNPAVIEFLARNRKP
jgi:hypothetical protein